MDHTDQGDNSVRKYACYNLEVCRKPFHTKIRPGRIDAPSPLLRKSIVALRLLHMVDNPQYDTAWGMCGVHSSASCRMSLHMTNASALHISTSPAPLCHNGNSQACRSLCMADKDQDGRAQGTRAGSHGCARRPHRNCAQASEGCAQAVAVSHRNRCTLASVQRGSSDSLGTAMSAQNRVNYWTCLSRGGCI